MIFWIFILLFFQHEQKNLTVLFLLLSGVIAVLAYAGGKQSNWLTDSQINFAKDNLSTDRGNKLEAQLRDAVINGLTTRAQNHEKRLQAFAQSTGYPNLTPEQTSFSDLLSTKHSNQLTADMRNGLLTRLTYAVTNHEMRLRALEKPTATPTKVDGKCGTAAATCLAGTVKSDNGQTACGTTRKWHCEGSNGWATAYNCPFQNPACYSCKGTYTWTNWHREWKKNYNVGCYCQWGTFDHRGKDSDENKCKGWSNTDHAQPISNPNWPINIALCKWGASDPTAWAPRTTFNCYKPGDNKPEYCLNVCADEPNESFCKKVYDEKECSSLSESDCKAQKGCRWGKNLVIRW